MSVHPLTDWTMQFVVGLSAVAWLTWLRYIPHGLTKYWFPSIAAGGGVFLALTQIPAFVNFVSGLEAPPEWDSSALILGVPAAAFAYAFGLSALVGTAIDMRRPLSTEPTAEKQARRRIRIQQGGMALAVLAVVFGMEFA
jgi:hypothetical protein